jgi:hypothetical protein
MHLPINVKSPNNIIKCQMEFNSAFKGLIQGRHLWNMEAGVVSSFMKYTFEAASSQQYT